MVDAAHVAGDRRHLPRRPGRPRRKPSEPSAEDVRRLGAARRNAEGHRAAAARHVHVRRLLQGQGALVRSALLPLQLDASRSKTCGPQRGAIGENGPTSAGWGRCDSDYPREAIVSPYPFKTAQEHYEALKAETTKRGGPTKHTYATVPGDEWTGRYGRASTESWYQARKMQVSTMMSLLTPKYQQYLVQEAYHSGNTNVAHWQSQYCWPEGFMRRWHQAAIRDHYITVTPQQVQIMTGIARNFITNILIGREFDMSGATPRLGADVPRWYGETIGFWDKDTLITWTSNVIGWKVHAGVRVLEQDADDRDLLAEPRRERQVPGVEPRSDLLRRGRARGADPHRAQLRQAGRPQRRSRRTSTSTACRRSSRSTARLRR